MVDPFRLSRQLARVELRRCMFAATWGPTASQSVVGVHVRPVQPASRGLVGDGGRAQLPALHRSSDWPCRRNFRGQTAAVSPDLSRWEAAQTSIYTVAGTAAVL